MGRGSNTTHDTGARKRQYGGGHFTPYPKKKSDNYDTKFMDTSLRYGVFPERGGGNSSQTKYMGSNAQKAMQILNSQSGTSNTHTTSQPLGAVGGIPSNTQVINTSMNTTPQPNFSNPLSTPNSLSLTQLQACKKQSTLDSHINQMTTPILNFPTLGIQLPQT